MNGVAKEDTRGTFWFVKALQLAKRNLDSDLRG
jgi:hypothetical protein